MDDLVAWLRKQLDEDAGLARTAFAEHNRAIADWHEPWSGTVEIGPDEDHVCCNDSGVSRHIVNWDPARALAEVDAKRRIITAIDDRRTWRSSPPPTFIDSDLQARVLETLALPYADRPGYREAWRP